MLNSGTILLDRYRIISMLGQGGMGAVYRAWDMRLNVPVALKEMTPQPGLDPQTLGQLRQQFQQEAMVLARLNHPHLVRVTDFFEEGDNTYLVMDFVKGESLADRITRQGSPPEQEVLTWAGQLLDALSYCHGQGVIHRDVKPQNVIIRGDGRAVLVDFGLVKLWDANDPHTKTVMRGMGTPEYAPPEQYETDLGHTDARSDIYSLGATLYHALAGQAPPTATLRMAAPEQFVPVRTLNPHTSAATETAILQAMELPRSKRWPSARAMAEALGAAGLSAPTQPAERVTPTAPTHEKTRVIPGAQPPAKPARRRIPAWAWALGGLAIVLLCITLLGVRALIVRRVRAAAAAQAQATATAQSAATATAQAWAAATAQAVEATATFQSRATATAQAQAQAQATATAQARATATAEAVAVADVNAPPQAAGWAVVFSASFDDPDVDGWPMGDYSDERLIGNRQIAEGKYRWDAEALDGVIWWSIPDGPSVSDFYLTVNARRVSGVADGQYGLIFRRAGPDNYGLFKIEDSQYFKFSVRHAGEWDTVIDWTETSAIRPVGANRLTVIAEGSHFTFYVNDEFVGEADDDRLSAGETGVAIELLDAGDAAIFEFDDFEVRAP